MLHHEKKTKQDRWTHLLFLESSTCDASGPTADPTPVDLSLVECSNCSNLMKLSTHQGRLTYMWGLTSVRVCGLDHHWLAECPLRSRILSISNVSMCALKFWIMYSIQHQQFHASMSWKVPIVLVAVIVCQFIVNSRFTIELAGKVTKTIPIVHGCPWLMCSRTNCRCPLRCTTKVLPWWGETPWCNVTWNPNGLACVVMGILAV